MKTYTSQFSLLTLLMAPKTPSRGKFFWPYLLIFIFFIQLNNANADNFDVTAELPGVQQTTGTFLPGPKTFGLETFDTYTPGTSVNSTNFGGVTGLTATIQFTATVDAIANMNGYVGGAGGTGNFVKGQYGPMTINLSDPVSYFGLWISALDGANVVKLYRDATLVYTFTAADMLAATGACPSTVLAPNSYCGNPTTNYFGKDPNEPFAFINFYNKNGTFNKIVLDGTGGRYSTFEADNFTVGLFDKEGGVPLFTNGVLDTTGVAAAALNPIQAATDILPATTNKISTITNGVSNSFKNNFDGGILTNDTPGVYGGDFVILSGGTIDQAGNNSTLTGVFSGSGGLTITNSQTGGSITLSNINTYTGTTIIDNGATLALTGAGSIASSSGLIANGTFDISGTTSGTSIKTLSGSGSILTGSGKSLTLTDAADTFSGMISGAGGLNIARGTETLSGINTYTGGTRVEAGATLAITNKDAIGTGTLDLVGSPTVSANFKTTTTMTISNPITVQGDPTFIVAPSTTLTISSPITDGASAGDVVAAGGGTLALTAVNTYTGPTTVNAGSTLALSGAGSITSSSALNNNGTVDLTGKSSNVTLGGTFTQSATGNLLMNISPSNTQKVLVTGAATLGGGLFLNASSEKYSSGKYALMSAGSVAGKFGTFGTNLSSYTRLGYALSYDASNVYLVFTPNADDTQQSIVNTAAALQNTFALQNTVLANSFSYDCTEFGANGVCISTGGRNTAVQAANGLNNTSALLIAAYRPHPNYRIGAYADQNLSVHNAGSTVNLGNNTPLIGLFGAWNQRLDGTGTEVKVSAAYGQKNTTVTRQVVGTSEPGSGSSTLKSQGAQLTAKYGFAVTDKAIVSPYVGMRYTQNNMGGYTEGASATVTAPLTYSALNTNATTALAGVGASYQVIPKVTTYASAGVETDTKTANGSYSGTSSSIAGLTPVNFNANPVKTRPTATLGTYYDVAKNQRLGITGIYRQEAYQAVSTTTVLATYTVGLQAVHQDLIKRPPQGGFLLACFYLVCTSDAAYFY